MINPENILKKLARRKKEEKLELLGKCNGKISRKPNKNIFCVLFCGHFGPFLPILGLV